MEMTEKEILAADTKALLENQILKRAFADYREAIVEQLENNPVDRDVSREKLVMALHVLKGVKSQLMQYIEDANVAKIQPEDY